MLGREIMMPDEVRNMDNKKCLVFVRGLNPIFDQKFVPFGHPMFSQSADGDGKSYEHKVDLQSDTVGPAFVLLGEKSMAYYETLKEKGENVYIDKISYDDFMKLGKDDVKKRFMDIEEQEQKSSSMNKRFRSFLMRVRKRMQMHLRIC